MDPDQVGVYKQVFLIVNTAVVVLPLGFGMSAFYFLPREPENRREAVLNILLVLTSIGLLGCAAVWLSPSILTAIFYKADVARYSPLIGVTLLLWIVGQFLETAPVANEEIRLATVLIIATQAARAMLLVAAAVVFATVRSLIWAAIIFGSVQSTVLICYLESRFPGFWDDARNVVEICGSR